MLKNLKQMQLKLLQEKQLKKTAEATSDLIGNKIAEKTTEVSKSSRQNNRSILDIGTEHKEITKERYISPEQAQQIIDNLKLI